MQTFMISIYMLLFPALNLIFNYAINLIKSVGGGGREAIYFIKCVMEVFKQFALLINLSNDDQRLARGGLIRKEGKRKGERDGERKGE